MAFVRHRRQKKKTAAELLHKKPGQMGPPHLHLNDVKKTRMIKTQLLFYFFLFEKKKEQKNI